MPLSMKSPTLNSSAQRTVDSEREFAACRDRFFASPVANAVLPWCFPGISLPTLIERGSAVKSTEDFQFAFVDPALQKILGETSQGLTISGLDRLPMDRKFLFISNHRCIVTDATMVSITQLLSGRGTCKVCLGDNLMEKSGVAELLLMVNGVVIKRTGTRKDVYASAQHVARYLTQQIEDNRYSVWLSQSPGRTKDGNDHTDLAIIKMLSLGCGKTGADFQKLHIVPVAVSYEFEPCSIEKVRETLIRREHGRYTKNPGEDLAQIRTSVSTQKGHIHLAFGEEITLPDAPSDDIAQDIVKRIDQQIWKMYRTWPSNALAHSILYEQTTDVASPYAQAFMAMLEQQVQELNGMGIASGSAREALLQLYAQPVANAMRAQGETDPAIQVSAQGKA